MTYETAYADLQRILQSIENEALTLTELEIALKQASELVAFCKQKLHATKKNIDTLIDDSL